MTTTLTITELEHASGRELGTTAWRTIDQEQVNLFAEATGDGQWIHVDPKAAASGPFGGTVAHGYLTLALLPVLIGELLEISDSSLGVNYGIERLRFPAPVRTGARIRLRAVLEGSERRAIGIVYRLGVTIEVDGQHKPALVGEVLYLAA
jgi:acyl dehydratase